MLISVQRIHGDERMDTPTDAKQADHLCPPGARSLYSERLRWARNLSGMSQEQLARLAGCTQANVSKLERTAERGSSWTAQIANALGVHPIWLATGQGAPMGRKHENERARPS